MIIELNELPSGSSSYDVLISPESIGLDREGVSLKGDVSFRGEVNRTAAQTEVRGTIAFAADIECTRCLKPVHQSFLFNFEADFVSAEDFSSAREHEVSGDAMDLDVLPGSRLDLSDVVREQILLNLPEQVFCSADCKGLCPECGADRNLIDCKCTDEKVDPRWSALKDMK